VELEGYGRLVVLGNERTATGVMIHVGKPKRSKGRPRGTSESSRRSQRIRRARERLALTDPYECNELEELSSMNPAMTVDQLVEAYERRRDFTPDLTARGVAE
jgi:hypothetical protein